MKHSEHAINLKLGTTFMNFQVLLSIVANIA